MVCLSMLGDQGDPDEGSDDDPSEEEISFELPDRMQQAAYHFAVATSAAMMILALGIYLGVRHDTLSSLPVPYPRWFLLFLAAMTGTLVERSWAIGYHGFKVKDYEPLTWRYHLAVGLRSMLVAIALVALGESVLSFTIDVGLPVLLAFGFGAGYFSESTFAVFEKRFRSMIGNPPSHRLPVRELIIGANLPIESLDEPEVEELLPETRRSLGEMVEEIRRAGFSYTHDFLGTYRTQGGRDHLEGVVGEDEQALSVLASVADVTRSGVHVSTAAELVSNGVRRAEDLSDWTDREGVEVPGFAVKKAKAMNRRGSI